MLLCQIKRNLYCKVLNSNQPYKNMMLDFIKISHAKCELNKIQFNPTKKKNHRGNMIS